MKLMVGVVHDGLWVLYSEGRKEARQGRGQPGEKERGEGNESSSSFERSISHVYMLPRPSLFQGSDSHENAGGEGESVYRTRRKGVEGKKRTEGLGWLSVGQGRRQEEAVGKRARRKGRSVSSGWDGTRKEKLLSPLQAFFE